jgi:hypothetical protein
MVSVPFPNSSPSLPGGETSETKPNCCGCNHSLKLSPENRAEAQWLPTVLAETRRQSSKKGIRFFGKEFFRDPAIH